MTKLIDLEGKRFGKLTVLKIGKPHVYSNGRKSISWLCRCDCGVEKEILGNNLVGGNTTSCGCYRKIESRKRNFIDIVGKKFNRLTVIERCDDYIDSRGNHSTRWRCLCDCGETCEVRGTSLKNGRTKSCGCYNKEATRESNLIDIKDKKFGKLVVIKLNNIDNKTGAYWLCECECGNIVIVLGVHLRNGVVKSCGCLSESFIASKIKEYLKENYMAKIEYKMLKNPKTNRWLRCDIYIPHGENPKINGFYIEIHGEQHYRICHFHRMKAKRKDISPEEEFEYQKYKDKIKKKYAKKNGIYIEIDVRKNKRIEDFILEIESKLK